MNLQQFRILVSAMTHHTFTDVSTDLGISQPTVIFHLKKLEKETGLEMYRKNFRHIVLTDAGKALLPYARQIVTLYNRSERLMKDYREMNLGRIRISSSNTPATYFLPRLLAGFQAVHPNIQVTLNVKTANRIIDQLNNYETDLGIISYTNVADKNLCLVPLIADELRLILPAGHPLAHKEKLELADLEDLPLMTHESGTTTRILTEQWARENNYSLNILMELGATETIKESVRCGIGAGILPFLTVSREIGRHEIAVRHLPNYVNHRFICLVYRKDNLISPLTESFIEFLMKESGKDLT